jgi:hypothetical protein
MDIWLAHAGSHPEIEKKTRIFFALAFIEILMLKHMEVVTVTFMSQRSGMKAKYR